MTTAAPATNSTASGMYHGWMPTPDRRGTTDLLWSCVSTIILCVWTAIHLPVPYYSRRKPKLSEDWRTWLRQKIIASRLVPALISFVIPELLAFMACQEFVKAYTGGKTMNLGKKGLIHSFFLNMGGFCLRSTDGTLCQLDFKIYWDLTYGHEEATSDSDDASATDVTSITSVTSVTSVTSPFEGTFYDSESLSELGDLGVVNEFSFVPSLTSTEAFGEPELWNIDMRIFSEDDIKAQSKADSVTKMIACFQALWFVTQVISRVAEGRAVTLLEVSTCAYVFSAFVAYVAWWKKPQSCSMPLMIDCPDDVIPKIPQSGYQENEGTWAEYFWGGAAWDPPELSPALLASIFFILPLCFGAIHIAAWNVTLPSKFEIWMWRSTTVFCCLLPLISFMPGELWGIIQHRSFPNVYYGLRRDLNYWDMLVLGSYAAVRVCMMIQILISMRSLPLSAYDTVNWSAAIPHI